MNNKLEISGDVEGFSAKGSRPGLLTGKQIDLRDESEYNLSTRGWGRV
jgi:hypothetical protein